MHLLIIFSAQCLVVAVSEDYKYIHVLPTPLLSQNLGNIRVHICLQLATNTMLTSNIKKSIWVKIQLGVCPMLFFVLHEIPRRDEVMCDMTRAYV